MIPSSRASGRWGSRWFVAGALCAFTTPLSAATPTSLPVALELARRGLASANDAAAEEAIAAASRAAGSAGLLVPPVELARLRYYEGVAAWRSDRQTEAMIAWRRLWGTGAWDPPDDGLLDDDGMAVLRALRSEGAGPGVPVRISGETEGVLVLGDGVPLGASAAMREGPHLVQVRCADGAVSSRWVDVEAGSAIPTNCRRSSGPAGSLGVNELALTPDVDVDLLQMALFGSYFAESTIRLAGMGEAPPPAEPAAAPAPPAAPVAPAPPAAPASPAAPAMPAELSDGLLACEDETPVYLGGIDAPEWSGPLTTEAERVSRTGARWLGTHPDGDASVRVEGEGSFGIRVFATAEVANGVAVRITPGRVLIRQLPDGPAMAREVTTTGRRILQVDTIGTEVRVRLDGTLLIGMSGVEDGPAVAVEGDEGARLGRVAVCRR